jgi:hypothetical protein
VFVNKLGPPLATKAYGGRRVIAPLIVDLSIHILEKTCDARVVTSLYVGLCTSQFFSIVRRPVH